MRARAVRLAASLAALIGAAGCAAHGPLAIRGPSHPLDTRNTGSGRPALVAIVREGDARGALAVAVTTEGIAADRGALAGVALAALAQERLAARGVDATAVGGWNGWRLRVLVASPADAVRVVDAVRATLLTPVALDDPALPEVTRKAAALARRPLVDPALADAAQCTGETYGAGSPANVTATELEEWRKSAHGLGRVAIATVGDATLADAAAQALGRSAPWPRATPVVTPAWPAPNAPSIVYGASGEIPAGSARIVVTARTATPERAVAAAPVLGDPAGPLASRLAGLEAPARVVSVTATAHVDGGCVATTIDLSARELASDAAARIATAAALARQELAVEIADGAVAPDTATDLIRRAADPRDAAERAAWWSLAGVRKELRQDTPDEEARIALTVGVAAPRDSPGPMSADAIRLEIDRATLAWRAPVVEARTRVERGQGETWVLLASPCGTGSESNGDAGIGAAVALAAAAQAADETFDAEVEPFVGVDGIGVLVHGPARPGEGPAAHARRLGDSAARAFASDEIAPARFTQARTTLLARDADANARAFDSLAGAVSPGHPSWLDAEGTLYGIASISDDAVAERAAAARAGLLRLAVVANVDSGQADDAVRAVDRWVARRPGESRTCPATPTPLAPRAGTYAVDVPAGAPSEVLIAAPLASGDAAARTSATWVAAALDGTDGLLARALGGSGPAGTALARTWSAVVVGGPQASALVVRVVGPDPMIDAAVSQVRSLLDRLRQGFLHDDDRARAAAVLGRARLAASLDPRARVIDLWRGPALAPAPSMDDLRAFATGTLRDEALVIVAARPSRSPSEKTPSR